MRLHDARAVLPPAAIRQTDPPASVGRQRYAPASSGRALAALGTALVYVAILAGCFMTFAYVDRPQAPSAPFVVNLLPLAAPQSPPRPERKPPRPVVRRPMPVTPPSVAPVDRTVVPVAQATPPMPVPAPTPAEPGPRQAETVAPREAPAPPATQSSNAAPDSWEGRLLARLRDRRRYPAAAQARRQQGVPYVRFVMDREGKVLSSRLERSSGFDALDREAVGLPKRAQPLPKPPADKPGDTIELVVPVEFLLRN